MELLKRKIDRYLLERLLKRFLKELLYRQTVESQSIKEYEFCQ